VLRLPADLLDRSPQEAARLLALGFLREATEARARLADARDTEALHDFRVAVRRLRSCIRAFRPHLKDSLSKKLRRGLRDLTAATNAARDAEVLLSSIQEQLRDESHPNGTEWLASRLEERQQQAQQRLPAEAMAPFDAIEPKLRKRLSRFETMVHLDGRTRRAGFGRVAGGQVRQLVKSLREQLATIQGPGDVDPAHRARITAKRLRYLLEPLARRSRRGKTLIDSLKGLQDLLGEMRDTHALQVEIAHSVEQLTAEGARRQAGTPPGSTAAPANTAAPRPDFADLARKGEARLGRLYTRLDREWLHGKAEPLLERVDRFGAGLESRRGRNVEIERKFLLTGVPDLAREVVPLEIDQGWIAGELVNERVRRTRTAEADSFSRTIKLGSGVVRSEFEEQMTSDVFESMWPLTVNRRISKRRYQVPDGELTWEIDEFTDRELVLAEVELPDEEAEAPLPHWLKPFVVREVTGEPEYVNVNLAK
jgi:CHAD domain-containing protein/CYTH domain-containing protein